MVIMTNKLYISKFNGRRHKQYTIHSLDYRRELWVPTASCAVSAASELLVIILMQMFQHRRLPRAANTLAPPLNNTICHNVQWFAKTHINLRNENVCRRRIMSCFRLGYFILSHRVFSLGSHGCGQASGQGAVG